MARARKGATEEPETPQQTDGSPAVNDMPPANPFGEPVDEPDAYDDGDGSEITAGTRKPSETVVEHPLSPTDSNPNPHGTRDDPEVFNIVVDKDTKIGRREAVDGDTEIEATHGEDQPDLHLGDGRTLHHGGRMKVSKEVAKDLIDQKKAKRV